MTICKDTKTIHYGTFELVAAINYVEKVVTTKDRKSWKLVPEVTVTRKPAKATETAQNQR